MSEFELIKKLQAELPRTSSKVLLGIGDDCAVLKPFPGKPLLTVDALVEGVHFDPSFCKPEEIGFKSLAVNLSDIASMGGEPIAAVISLGVNPKFNLSFYKKIYSGISELARRFKVDVVGGNITTSPNRLFISTTILGKSSGFVLNRSGAKKGDWIFVSGTLGGAAAGLHVLKKVGRRALKTFPNLCERYLKPQPQLDLGNFFSSQSGVHSLIDISDGLSSELWHLAESSRQKFVVEEEAIPTDIELNKLAKKYEVDKMKWVLSGGEDYELLGTCSSSHWIELCEGAKKLGIRISKIGKVLPGPKQVLMVKKNGRSIPLKSSGWNHLMT